nr:MAG TPA: hypothetical protein [Caudoviricetes sp.]
MLSYTLSYKNIVFSNCPHTKLCTRSCQVYFYVFGIFFDAFYRFLGLFRCFLQTVCIYLTCQSHPVPFNRGETLYVLSRSIAVYAARRSISATA